MTSAPCGYPVHPLVQLDKRTGKGNTETWVPSKDNPKCDHLLSKGRPEVCIVLSHSCDLDKKERSGRVIVAPAKPLDRVQEPVRQLILAQERLSMMPLPNVPGLGDLYVDLRVMLSLYRQHCEQARKLASMTAEGQKRLQAQLIAFFARVCVDATG